MEAFSREAREAFARELRAHIERSNATQKEFAQHAGLSASMVSNWLNCDVLPEELTRLEKVARATNTDVFAWVSLLLGRSYSYDTATTALRNENEQLKIELAALKARVGR